MGVTQQSDSSLSVCVCAQITVSQCVTWSSEPCTRLWLMTPALDDDDDDDDDDWS